MINGNRNLYNLASRCVFKNYNSIKNIADVNGEFGNHVLDNDNPHNVNKTQIGLSNVLNIDCTNPSSIIQTSNYRFTTDTEKSTWNNKQDAITGITDTITVITSVDFNAKTTTSKTITITNGIVTNII